MTGAVAQTLTFPVTNAAKRAAKGPITARVMCFNEARKPVNVTTAKVRTRGLAAGQTVTATVRLAQLCPTALVAARSASSPVARFRSLALPHTARSSASPVARFRSLALPHTARSSA
jgi:hypothetical protein